jgi:hypothetical protein
MSSRKIRISVATTLAAFVTLTFDATPAHAYATWSDHKLIGGVGAYGNSNQYYYVDGSANAHLATAVGAMDDWIYTTTRTGITTPISFLRTTYRPASVMDVFKTGLITPWWGITSFYNGATEQDVDLGNWYWTYIQLDGAFSQCANQRGVIAHEMGHAMGLAHVTTPSSLMYDDLAYTAVQAAVADDLNGVNHLYT